MEEFKLKQNKLTNICQAVDNQVRLSDRPLDIKKPFFYIINGGKGSGKSSLLSNLITCFFRGKFDRMYMFSPTARNDGKKYKKLIKELDKDNRFYDDFRADEFLTLWEDEIKTYYTEFKEEHKRKPHILIILDDIIGSLKTTRNKDMLDSFIIKHRHFGCSVVLCTQKLKGFISTTLRTNINYITTFRINERTELDSFLKMYDCPESIYRFAVEGEYNFLHISFNSNPPRYFKKFNEIIIDKNIV